VVLFRRSRRIRKLAAEAIADAEQHLSGRVLDTLDRWRREVPIWALVSALGHADWDELHRVAAGRRGFDNSLWLPAVAFLASEIIAMAGNSEGLLRIQREALIPLELALLGDEVQLPPTLGDFVNLVTKAIHTPRRPGW
jgi:hypothetical protein